MADHDDLDRELRSLAERLDRESRATTPDAAMALASGVRARSRRPVLATAAGMAAVVALAVGLVVAAQPDDGIDVRVGEPTTPTAATPSTPTSVHAGPDFNELPDGGIAVSDGEGEIELLAFGGSSVAVVPTDLAGDVASAPTRTMVAVRPGGQLDLVDADLAEAPDGCDEAAGGGGLRVALCGGQPQVRERVVTVDAAGTTTPLVDGPAPGEQVGHWRWAIPSPDGEWVLAQWSGECEVPLAHLVSADGSTVRPVGKDGVSTTGIGWAPDGRMLVQFGPGLCGTGIDEPGIYAVDADTGARELLRADPEGRSIAARWERRAHPNEVELMAFRALDELGLTGCCGEPSHGGAGLTAGAVWEGEDIAISASPVGAPPGSPASSLRPAELAGTPVVFGETDGQPFVAFTCGGYVWRVGSGLQPGPASEAGVHALAEALLPHLYCTVGPRPQA